MRRGIPRLNSFGSHRRGSSAGRPITLPLFGRSRVGFGIVRSPPLAVAKAVLVLARSIGNRGIDEHPDLATGVHHVLTNGFLALKRVDDILQPASAVDFLVSLFTFAVIFNVVVVMPSTEAVFYLCHEAVKHLVCECFDYFGLVMRASDPPLHRDGAGVVLGTLPIDHGIINSFHVERTVALNIKNGIILARVYVRLTVEPSGFMSKITGFGRTVECVRRRSIYGVHELSCRGLASLA